MLHLQHLSFSVDPQRKKSKAKQGDHSQELKYHLSNRVIVIALANPALRGMAEGSMKAYLFSMLSSYLSEVVDAILRQMPVTIRAASGY